MKDLEPIVLCAVATPRAGVDIELELNIRQVTAADLRAFPWGDCTGRRCVVVPGNTEELAELARKLEIAATAARASSVARMLLPPGAPVGWDITHPLPKKMDAARFRQLVFACEFAPNSSGLPDIGLLTAARRAVVEFPTDIFPRDVQKAIRIVAAGAGAPIDYVAISLIAGAMAATAGGVEAEVRPGWREPSVLWAMLIGDPSGNKSPSLRSLEAAITEVERAEHRRETAAAALEGRDPVHRVFRLSDATMPATYETLARQGIPPMLLTHEGGALLNAVAASWKSTSDRASANALYDGGQLWWQRRSAGAKPFLIERGAVSILAAVQPDALSASGVISPGAVSDGFAERFLLSWPAPADQRLPAPSSDALAWADGVLLRVVERCRSLAWRCYEADPVAPLKVTFDPVAAALFDDWRLDLFDHERAQLGQVTAATGKAPGHAARLALALHLIEWAAGPANDLPEIVPPGTVECACGLRAVYFEAHRQKALAEAETPAVDKLATTLARHVAKLGLTTLDPVRIRTVDRVPGLATERAVIDALRELQARNWLDPAGPRVPDPRDWKSEVPKALALHPRLPELLASR